MIRRAALASGLLLVLPTGGASRPGTYQFGSRLRKISTGRATGRGATTSLTVTS